MSIGSIHLRLPGHDHGEVSRGRVARRTASTSESDWPAASPAQGGGVRGGGCTGWRSVVEKLQSGLRRTWPSPLTPRRPAAARGTPRQTRGWPETCWCRVGLREQHRQQQRILLRRRLRDALPVALERPDMLPAAVI
jgi:hypothetical protein